MSFFGDTGVSRWVDQALFLALLVLRLWQGLLSMAVKSRAEVARSVHRFSAQWT